VTRPIRQTVDVVRRVVPVRIRVRRFAERIAGKTVGLIRFRRGSVRSVRTQPPPPPRPAQCRVPTTTCSGDWSMFDDYEILEVFGPACTKYTICNSCAANRKFDPAKCLSALKRDMEALCVPFNDPQKYPGWYAVGLKQAAKFHMLAKGSQKSVPSPAWCVDSCVVQKGSPDVTIKA